MPQPRFSCLSLAHGERSTSTLLLPHCGTMVSDRQMGILWGSNPNPNPNPRSKPSSDSSSGSEMELGSRRLGGMELDAARALADMAKVERSSGEGDGGSTKRAKHAALASGGKSLKDLDISISVPMYVVDEDHQDSKTSDAEVDGRLKFEKNSEFSVSNINHTGSYVSCFGRRMKQNMTEAEKEARRIRRVLANRESARQTIRRRQALREELIKRVADLSMENENMKVEKDLVMKEYLSLKDTNKALKKQMAKAIKYEVELRAKITSSDVETSASPSTELSLVAPIRSSGAALAPWRPFSPDASACNEVGGSSKAGASRTLFYMPPYSWFCPLLHRTSESYPPCSQASDDSSVDFIDNHHGFSHYPHVEGNLSNASLPIGRKLDARPAETAAIEGEKTSGINLEEMPKEFDEDDEVAPAHSHGAASSFPDVKGEQGIGYEWDRMMTDQIGKKPQVSPLPPLKKLVDPLAAAAARKRRKELTKLKYFHARQIGLHG